MSNITLEGIAAIIHEEIKPINERLNKIENTLEQHTAALASLATDMKKVLDEKTVSAQRFERLEKWAGQVGPKVGIKLEF